MVGLGVGGRRDRPASRQRALRRTARSSGVDSADMQEALWTAVLQAAALRPADARAATARIC